MWNFYPKIKSHSNSQTDLNHISQYHLQLCSDDDGSTCDLTNVQYSEYPSKQTSLDTSDNHIYQCYAQITMVDDAVVELWSHTVKLDVYCTLT